MTIVSIALESFGITETEENGIDFSGIAIPFNVESRNGAKYNTESTIRASKSMVGRPILWNHDDSIPALGHVEAIEVVDDTGLGFKANLDPEEKDIIRKIRRGDIKNVSIQAIVDDTQTKGNEVCITEFLELTICNIPGFKDAKIKSIEKYIKEKTDEVKEMAGEEKPKAEEKPEEKPEPEPKQEEKVKTEVDDEEEDEVEMLKKDMEDLRERIASIEAGLEAKEESDEDEEEESDEDEEEESDEDEEEESDEDEEDEEKVKSKQVFDTKVSEVKQEKKHLFEMIREVNKK